jgi:cell division protein FtsN
MARDYAKPAAAKKRQAKHQRLPLATRTPSWTVFLGGAVVGIAATLVAVLWRPDQGDQPASDDSNATAPAEPKPRFDFYTLLKESEVFVPEVEEPQLARTPPPADETREKDDPKVPEQKAVTYEYVLQAGSFRSRGDADSLRARLLLLNLRAGVESAGTRPGEVWHRVMVGPFTSQETLVRARAALQQNGIDNILVKRKQD